MRCGFSRQLSFIVIAGFTAASEVGHCSQSDGAGSAPTQTAAALPAPTSINPGITVTGTAATPAERPLPALPPIEFTDCMRDGEGLSFCAFKLDMERHLVIEKCFNRIGDTAPTTVIQACSESLDHNLLQAIARSYLLVNRADAYFANGDNAHAIDDYNHGIRLAPKRTKLYYNRGVFYEAQAERNAALRDFDAAIKLKPTLAPALHQRAKLYGVMGNFSKAISDYSQAIHLQPDAPALWTERGFVYLRQHDYQSAARDETEAIRLDPTLARAFFPGRRLWRAG